MYSLRKEVLIHAVTATNRDLLIVVYAKELVVFRLVDDLVEKRAEGLLLLGVYKLLFYKDCACLSHLGPSHS